MNAIFLLPGNHLYPASLLRPHRATPIVMVEDEQLCRRRPYHQQKLALLLAGMREHAALLRKQDYDVRYAELDANTGMFDFLEAQVVQTNAQQLLTFAITDHSLRQRMQAFAHRHRLDWREVGDPGFVTGKTDFAAFAQGKPQLRMAGFYRTQRRSLNVLLDGNGSPKGGQWSYDADNRKRVPKSQSLPDIPHAKHSELTRATCREVSVRFADHSGSAESLWLPTTRRGALAWLNRFLKERLIGFGTYEDALTTRSATLFHSTLSPLLNLGLITPNEVLERTLAYADEQRVPINDLEGFIRQLIGWREFVRGVYDNFPEMGESNVRNHTRRMTDHWRKGDTGLPPLDVAIANHQKWGWNHHIERLMVLSNLMNLCEIQPREVYEYFMTHYIDAYPWVMPPNVYGMGLTSDGGVFATKPYICGANYLLKMSDYPRGPWCDVVDGLYWRFVARNREELSKNPRLAAFASGVDRLKPERKARIFGSAENFLER